LQVQILPGSINYFSFLGSPDIDNFFPLGHHHVFATNFRGSGFGGRLSAVWGWVGCLGGVLGVGVLEGEVFGNFYLVITFLLSRRGWVI
jgi:hypothetical protein